MDEVLEKGRKRKISVDSVDGQVAKKKDQDPSILVAVAVDVDPGNGSVTVEVFGEELRHRLEGQIFFFREAEPEEDQDRVRRILF
jgi:hypothetical protein